MSAKVAGHRFLARLVADRPLVIAHRGDSFHAPENTLESAQGAYQAGADAWELDVHLTRDGVPVVLHDESLLRTTDVAQKFASDPRRARDYLVAEFDVAEVRSLDTGSWFLDPSRTARTAKGFGTSESIWHAARVRFLGGQVRIPTLAEALDLTAGLDWLVNVELKSVPTADPRLAEVVIALVREREMVNRVLISSFDHADVGRVVRLAPEIATGVLTTTPLYRPGPYVREWVGADAYHPSAEAIGACSAAYRRAPSSRTLRVADLASLREAGVPVCVYTVNDSAPGGLAEHLAGAGISAVFTDDPGSLRRQWGPRGNPEIRRLARGS